MPLPSPGLIGAVFGFSELLISLGLRARDGATRKDRSSLPLIWIVVIASIGLGMWLSHRLPGALLPWPHTSTLAGLVLFTLGLLLRWWSILTLGRFFTVQVAIHSGHRLIERGPYRVLRHPSYSGVLLELLGFAFSIGNWMSLLAMFVPILGVFGWRIHVEEAALGEQFGDAWRDYVRRTWRLLPLVF